MVVVFTPADVVCVGEVYQLLVDELAVREVRDRVVDEHVGVVLAQPLLLSIRGVKL